MSPALSKAMRRAAGMAAAIQKGEMKTKPGSPSAQMAKMAPESLEHYASTKEAGLPMHKKGKNLKRFGYDKKLRKETDRSGKEMKCK